MGQGRAKNFLSHTYEPDVYLYMRKDYYYEIVKKNPSQEKFLNGWINRLKELCKATGVKIDVWYLFV